MKKKTRENVEFPSIPKDNWRLLATARLLDCTINIRYPRYVTVNRLNHTKVRLSQAVINQLSNLADQRLLNMVDVRISVYNDPDPINGNPDGSPNRWRYEAYRISPDAT